MSELVEAAVSEVKDNRRIVCPECGPNRKKSNPTLSVSQDAEGTLYYCHHCGVGGMLKHERAEFTGPQPVSPVRLPEHEDSSLVASFLKSRGIDRSKCSEYPVIGGTKWFRDVGEVPAVGFMYGSPGDVRAVKWRGTDTKAFTQEGAAATFWGLGQLPADAEDFIIVEGEMDVLAMRMAGIRAVSVPNGAPAKVSNRRVDPSEDGKFAYVWEARDRLETAKRVIIAGDMDEQGEALREELARRIDRAKCWFVEWPAGCKDANDVLLKHGPDALKSCVDKAAPLPLEGVYSANEIAPDVTDLFEQGLVRGESVNIDAVDEVYTVLPGQLTVVTGVPSSGKSEFVDQVVVNLARHHNWRIAIASFENPMHFHVAKLAEKLVGRPFFEGPTQRMTKTEMEDSLAWINEHFVFLHHHDAAAPSIRSILNRTKQAVMRMGVRGLVIDPFNYLDVEMSTEAIRAMLRDVCNFAKAHGIHIWFVAHPSKMYKDDQGRQRVPTGYDISGSAHWFNAADMGLTVHREEAGPELHCWKARFKWIGRTGVAQMEYDVPTGRYSTRRTHDRWSGPIGSGD